MKSVRWHVARLPGTLVDRLLNHLMSTLPHWITAHHIILKSTILLKLYIYETLNKRHTLLSRTRHITLYHVIPHHSTPYHEKEHCKTSHHTLSCHTTPQHTISWKRTLRHVISHFSMPCNTRTHRIIKKNTIAHHTTLYHAIPRHTIPQHSRHTPQNHSLLI